MKAKWCGLVIGLAAFTGCIELPMLHDVERKPAPKAESPRSTPIMANEINDANAHAKADALQRELDEDDRASDVSAGKSEAKKGAEP